MGGDPGRSDRIEIGFIIAAMYDVIETGSSGEPVDRDVEDVIGFIAAN
ncbi:hypothetical protein [Rhodopirellula europaea]|nr:hypothetical protein [Rhodopirellula europaea]